MNPKGWSSFGSTEDAFSRTSKFNILQAETETPQQARTGCRGVLQQHKVSSLYNHLSAHQGK